MKFIVPIAALLLVNCSALLAQVGVHLRQPSNERWRKVIWDTAFEFLGSVLVCPFRLLKFRKTSEVLHGIRTLRVLERA